MNLDEDKWHGGYYDSYMFIFGESGHHERHAPATLCARAPMLWALRARQR